MRHDQGFAWLTAGDDDVDEICEVREGQVETLDTWAALGLPPLHINCRCDLVPADDFAEGEAVRMNVNEFLDDIDFDELDSEAQADALRQAADNLESGGF